jgi:hypothetical protein
MVLKYWDSVVVVLKISQYSVVWILIIIIIITLSRQIQVLWSKYLLMDLTINYIIKQK